MYVSNTNKITKHHEQGGRDLIGGVYCLFNCLYVVYRSTCRVISEKVVRLRNKLFFHQSIRYISNVVGCVMCIPRFAAVRAGMYMMRGVMLLRTYQ